LTASLLFPTFYQLSLDYTVPSKEVNGWDDDCISSTNTIGASITANRLIEKIKAVPGPGSILLAFDTDKVS
jgi:hypothetical protein